MDNEPAPPSSSTPPPPDLTPPPPSPGPPPPSFSPPPPAPPPPPGMMDPIPKAKPASRPAAVEEEESGELPPPGSEAPFNQRALAGIVDSLVGVGLSILLQSIPHFGWLTLPAIIAYLLVRDALPFLGGQSIGKKVMKLQAVTQDGKSLSGDWQGSAVRNIPMIIPLLNLYEAYLLWQKNEEKAKLRRLGDDWAKTKVIVAEDAVASS